MHFILCFVVSQKIESLRKTGSKTLLLTILVYIMISETITDLPGEGKIHNKDDRSVIVFNL